MLVVTLAIGRSTQPVWADDDGPQLYRQPSFLSEYDIATRDDLRLSYHLRPLVSGEIADDWPILEGIEDQLGERITQFLSAPQIAETITQAMPTEGQAPLRQIQEIVAECCQILHVKQPEVFVRSHWHPNAYVTQAGASQFLILTSGLLDLYEGHPEELRFVIGHELGHLKCGHLQTRRAAYGLHVAVQSVNLTVVPDEYQAVLPTLSLGWLFSWSRESEISADRAGLLCCQDPRVAYNALLRLLSGIRAESEWIDPDSPDFDPDEVLHRYRMWENEPFVELVVYIKRQTAQSPFIPERLAALKNWAASGADQKILSRQSAATDDNQLVVIRSITVHEVCEQKTTVDPYVIAFDRERKLFHTSVASDMRSVKWTDLGHAHRCRDGQPLQFEVWDSNFGPDTLLGGFMIFPARPDQNDGQSTDQTARLVWNWKKRSSNTGAGFATVELEFRNRAE